MTVVTATIKGERETLKLTSYRLLSIDTTKEFNKVPLAELKLYDGDIAKQEFKTLDDDFFIPGKKIEFFLKYEGDLNSEERIFSGIVVNHSLEWTSYGSTLTVELSDQAIKMTGVRKNAVFEGQKDSKIISSLVSQNKLKTGQIAKTDLAHTQMVQHYTCDWDFMLSRAEANGQWVIADDGKISTIEPKVKSPSLVLEYGVDFFNFDLQLNSRDQYNEVSSVAWDMKGQKLATTKGKDYKLEQTGYDISGIAKTLGAQKASVVHAVDMGPAERQSWSDAQIMKSRLSLLQGTIKIRGNGKVQVGQTVELRKLSRFTGKHIISGVRQVYTLEEDWYTYLQIGMDANWFTARPNLMDTQAAGLLPGINGLQVGVVAAHEKDPDNQFRVRVTIPAFGTSQPGQGTVWARLASVDAGAGRGVFFRPEKGDEVVVGFLNDDPRQALILGAMHSQANKTPALVNKTNSQKGIFTKSNYQLLFDEENKMITLSTPGKNQICIDEKNGMISLSDANENKVELSKKGVVINSAKDFQINAKGNFDIKADGKVKISGKKIDLI
ncbi:MAG: type VI secretion system tip protein VgrG [Bacteroidota bacterium]